MVKAISMLKLKWLLPEGLPQNKELLRKLGNSLVGAE